MAFFYYHPQSRRHLATPSTFSRMLTVTVGMLGIAAIFLINQFAHAQVFIPILFALYAVLSPVFLPPIWNLDGTQVSDWRPCGMGAGRSQG